MPKTLLEVGNAVLCSCAPVSWLICLTVLTLECRPFPQLHQEKMKDKKKKKKKDKKHKKRDSDSSDEEDEATKREKLKKVHFFLSLFFFIIEPLSKRVICADLFLETLEDTVTALELWHGF